MNLKNLIKAILIVLMAGGLLFLGIELASLLATINGALEVSIVTLIVMYIAVVYKTLEG